MFSQLNDSKQVSLFSQESITTSYTKLDAEGNSTNQKNLLPTSCSTAQFSTPTPSKEMRIPPKLRTSYTDIKLISEHEKLSGNTTIFEAKSKVTNELHIIKVLELPGTSSRSGEEDVKVTLFLQELLHLCSTQPELVIINSFIMDDNTFAYSLRSSTSLKAQLEAQKKNKPEEKSTLINIPRMISDVVSDVEFLYKERKIRNFESSMKIDDIFYNCKNKKYWLGNWMNISFENLIVISYEDNSNNEPLASLDISEELSSLGMILKELTGITHPEMDKQAGLKIERLISRLMSNDPQQLPTIKELKEMTSFEKAEEIIECIGADTDKVANKKKNEAMSNNIQQKTTPKSHSKKDPSNCQTSRLCNRSLIRSVIHNFGVEFSQQNHIL